MGESLKLIRSYETVQNPIRVGIHGNDAIVVRIPDTPVLIGAMFG